MPTTKLRSWLIAAAFTSYGLGNILINLVTLVIRDSQTLVNFSIIFLLPAVIPAFFYTIESPQWLYKDGRVNSFGKSLVAVSKRNKTGLKKREFMEQVVGDSDFNSEDLENTKIRVKILMTDKKSVSKFMQILENFSNIFTSFR